MREYIEFDSGGSTIDPSFSSGGKGGDLHYIHRQSTPSKEWRVAHKLGKFPSVTVVDSAGTVVVGDVRHVDKNNVVLSFSGAFSGTAFFN